MNTIPRISLVLFGSFLLIFSCKQAEAPSEEAAISNEKIAVSADSVSPVKPKTVKQPQRKFIRTAELKFKVKNVSKSTDAIENAARKYGGFVASSELESTINKQFSTKISQDSTLETTRYTVENNIRLRIPNAQFDTVVKTIAREVAFLDSRHIKADDVALQLLSNEMAQRRSAKHQQRLENAVDTKGKKLNQIVNAEDKVDETGTAQDDKKIENLALQDQVNFSTITLHIYQKETVKQEIVANEKDASAYEPPLGLQLLDSIKSGWYILESLLVFVVHIWSLILLGILIYLGIKRYSKK
ncbi:DUF4349 domain-containing protein [Flavobacterium sp.]|uniref:DUF4349 domain-containing protein n=1 Tax=Flavobacterium sp. TaxID=239 RepID=UPI002613F7C7|nr:DUF4349 domain-containing protein [Flavobacterium sp.]